MRHIIWPILGGAVLTLAAVGSFSLALWVADRHPPIEYQGARSAIVG